MRWLAEYRIKTKLRLEEGQDEISRTYDDVRITVRNAPDFDYRGQGLIARLIFSAGTVEDAESVADEHVEGFLNLLSFATNVGARVAHRTFLAEWPETPAPVRQFLYANVEVDDPFEIVNLSTLELVENLANRQTDATLAQAYGWYNTALRSPVLVDQFQLFWFVIEALSAKVTVPPTPDSCRCGGPIVCSSCGEAVTKSTSRKRIEAVLESTGLGTRHIKGLSKVGNLLLHGADQADVESYMRTTPKMKSPDFTLAAAVTILSDYAWVALAKTMSGYMDDSWPTLPHADTVKTIIIGGRTEIGLPSGVDMNSLPIGTLTVRTSPTTE